MYNPKHFQENEFEVLRGLITGFPLGALVMATADGLDANHIPFVLQPAPAPYGKLHGHIARANPLWRHALPDSEV